MRSHQLAALALSLGLVATITGCGGPETAPLTETNKTDFVLNDIGEMYRQYAFSKKKPANSLADFAPLDTVAPLGFKALKDGDVIARAGVEIKDVMEGPATTDPADDVLAYAKEVPTSGGLVLMHNRTVKQMTADEFKAAKLAGTGDLAAGSTAKSKH
ncbi:hypothetical protein [Planctomyces sp. SH-PL62]|uniref:hypothetical protein n=1 Tax=Planctomyces sp. SH-PL62 TaxID=1636152 RepID=UPI00078BCD64|nr:hypothetical protein [Planctomyces sp. SH-PL62]AMV38045.1 hypothetical protein VT85_11450 [Planctomyces sp. SH-PL62]